MNLRVFKPIPHIMSTQCELFALRRLLTAVHFFHLVCHSVDLAMSFKGLSRALVPELAVDQQLVTASSCALPLPKDCDLDTESTVL